ncbi:MAG: NB-ARC domain-containing protein [Chloroflexota bacterium]
MSNNISNAGNIAGSIINNDTAMNNVTQAIINIINQNVPLTLCPMAAPEPLIFSGRSADLATLKERLKDPNVHILAAEGLGGIGKTTLISKLANDLIKEKIFRAVLWTDVNSQLGPLNLLRGWASYANPTFTFLVPEGTQINSGNFLKQQALLVKTLLEAVIGEKCEQCEPGQVLVVLDDVGEEDLKTAQLLLMARPTNSTVLVTCRSHNVAIELNAESIPISPLNAKDGLTLLQDHHLRDSDPALLSALAERLHGHPLALTLAAKQVRRKSSALAKLIETGPKAGTVFSKLKQSNLPDQNDELTMVFARSYEDLSPQEQACFRGLGILAQDQPFDKNLLATLWEVSPEESEEYCNRLIELSLLETAEKEKHLGEGWYRLHPLLQEYALKLLEEGITNE